MKKKTNSKRIKKKQGCKTKTETTLLTCKSEVYSTAVELALQLRREVGRNCTNNARVSITGQACLGK